MADTSYSDVTSPDMRGRAVSEVLLYPDSTVRVLGSLQDGESYDYTLARGVGKPDELVGLHEMLDQAALSASGEPLPRFVKAKLRNGRYLMCCVTDGFKYSYSEAGEEEARRAVGMAARLEAYEASMQMHLEALRRSQGDLADAPSPALDPWQPATNSRSTLPLPNPDAVESRPQPRTSAGVQLLAQSQRIS